MKTVFQQHLHRRLVLWAHGCCQPLQMVHMKSFLHHHGNGFGRQTMAIVAGGNAVAQRGLCCRGALHMGQADAACQHAVAPDQVMPCQPGRLLLQGCLQGAGKTFGGVEGLRARIHPAFKRIAVLCFKGQQSGGIRSLQQCQLHGGPFFQTTDKAPLWQPARLPGVGKMADVQREASGT